MHRLLTGPLSIERLTIPIAELPPQLSGTVLVQLSDFHYDGLRLSEQLLAQTIAAINSIQPDLILLTGDYVTDEPDPIEPLTERLQQLQSRHGIYASLGNHDVCRPDSRSRITQAFRQHGMHVLWDQIAYPLGDGLALVGLRDYWSPRFRPAPVMNQIHPQTPRIVLSHNPDSAQTLQKWRVDLQLSGHTHGGQIVIPGIGPIIGNLKKLRQRLPKQLPRSWRRWSFGDRTVQFWQWSQGLHQVGSNLIYVNRGLGTYFPGRLFCPPEITVLTLAPKFQSPQPQFAHIQNEFEAEPMGGNP
jgi:uncharacterized protein